MAETLRLDVWLWRARFFKTRTLAADHRITSYNVCYTKLLRAMIDTGAWTQQAQMIVGTVEPASRDGGFLTLPVIDNGVFVGPVPLGKLPGTGS